MQVAIRLLQDNTFADGTEGIEGEFYNVDERVSKQLVDDLIAEQKTPEEAQADEERRIQDEQRREKLQTRDTQMKRVQVIGERAAADPLGGYASFGEFIKDVARAGKRAKQGGGAPKKLQKWHNSAATKTLFSQSAANEFDDSQGGFLVPPEYANRLHNIQLESSIIRPRATFVPMGTNRIGIPAVVDEDHSSNLFGGISISRESETEQKSTTKPTFRSVWLTLHKLVGLTAASDELIEDSPQSIETILTNLFGQAIAFQEDTDFLNGTGVGQALGIVNAPCTIAQAAEPLQAADTVVAANIVNMWSRLHPMSMRNAVWMCNQSVLPQLYQMGLAVGTGGSVVFTPAGGLSASPYAALMGRPLIPTEKLPTLGDTGDIVLADLTQYAIGGKSQGGAPKIDTSMHIWFDYDLMAFRFVLRYDGQPMWRVALTPANGPTLSPFVRLAERA